VKGNVLKYVTRHLPKDVELIVRSEPATTHAKTAAR
jgi:hypothetical protein